MNGRNDRLFSGRVLFPAFMVLAFLIGYWAAGRGTQAGSEAKASSETIQHQPSGALPQSTYVCPMMCVPPRNQPGSCPVCGMALTPAGGSGRDAHGESSPTLKISPSAVSLASIQIAPVERKFVTAEIRLFGRIEYDPVEQFKVTAYAPGVIDRIYVQRAGQTVRSGDPLFDIHSPELYYLEQELLEILKDLPYRESLFPARGQKTIRTMRPPTTTSFTREDPNASPEKQAKQKEAWDKLEQIRRKMQLLGLTHDAIDLVVTRGRPTGISTVSTPTTGIILEQNAFKGSFVNTGDPVFTVANPSYMWANLDAYESDFAWLRVGQEAEFETDAFPGEKFPGRIQYLDPKFDPEKRTFAVGVLYTDPNARLAPNMLVRCMIRARMTADGVATPDVPNQKAPLVIPDTAPLITGERAVVYVADPKKPGEFEGREVLLGARAKGYYIVKHGLKKGEQVVVNGSFKIDSAVQILARSSMMTIPGDRPALAHHDHGGSAVMPKMHEPVSTVARRVEREEPAGAGRDAGHSRSFADRLDSLMSKRQQAQTSQQK